MNVFDSSAIAIYLVEKFAKGNALYPVDLKLRTKINMRLFYVSSYIFPRIFQMFVPIFFRGATELPQALKEEMIRGYSEIESFLEGGTFLAGNAITLADLYLWAIMESLGQVIPIDKEKFPKFDRWLIKMREHPSSEVNKKGAVDHINFLRQCIAKNLAAKN